MKQLFLFPLWVLVLLSCQKQEIPEEFIGSWQARSLQVLDSTWNVEIDPIQLTITPDQRYILTWYGGFTETGKISIANNWMQIQANDQSARKIRILYFGQDTMSITGPINDQRTEIGFVRLKDEDPGI
ncbi:MAG: hypothetical protein IPJ06_10360 [Saprospiraceae bacterium]|nr:hypothetical protein [Saprospiraceae bacterium]